MNFLIAATLVAIAVTVLAIPFVMYRGCAQ